MFNFDDMISTVLRNCDVPCNDLIDAARLSYARLGGTQLERSSNPVGNYQLPLESLLNVGRDFQGLMRFMKRDYSTRACYDKDWLGYLDTNKTQTNRFWGMVRLMGDAINASETTADVYGPVDPEFVSFDETNPEHNLADTQMVLDQWTGKHNNDPFFDI